MSEPKHLPPSVISPDVPCLFDYIEVTIKHRRLIFKATVAALIISILITLILPKKYSSTARILPPQQDTNLMGLMLGGGVGGFSSLAGGMLGLGTPADQYASMLESQSISDAIIDRFKLLEVYNKKFRLEMYKKLDKLVEIKAGKKDGIISITVEDEDPKRASDMANAYIEELAKLTVELNMTGGGRNKLFLEKRLAQSRADLAKAEEEIKKFQIKTKAIDVSEQAKASIVGIAELRSQLVLQELQLAGLSRRFTENSQEVKDTNAAISRIKAQISHLEGTGDGGAIPTVGSLPNMGQEYIRLMREFKIQETIVELLTKQYELSKLIESKDVSSIQVIQRARTPDKKIKPKRTQIVVVLTFTAFIISVCFVIIREYVKNLSENERQIWLRFKSAWHNQGI